MTGTVRILGALLVGLAVAPRARAMVTYRSHVPNGYVYDCYTCHEEDIPQLNWFGVDLALASEDESIDWSRVWWIDSDGDGLTNGQELGDPCGVWDGSADPEITDESRLSNPGDASDISGDPAEPCGVDTGAPEVEDDADSEAEAGGCLYSTLGRSRTPGGLALLGVMGVVLVGRRRRGGR